MNLTATLDKLAKLDAGSNKLPRDLTAEEFIKMLEAKVDEDQRTGKRQLRPIQRESINAGHRFNAEIWHRRAGKSVVKAIKILTRAVACPFNEPQYAFLAPTQDQVKSIIWKYLLKFGEAIPGFDYRESSREVFVPTLAGSVALIKLFGVDNPKQRLRGLYLDGCVFDEYQDTPSHVYTEQVRPTLSDSNRQGVDLWGYPNQWCDFIGTPKGRNQLYEVYSQAKTWFDGDPVYMEDPETKKIIPVFRQDWRGTLHKASETGILSKQELLDAYNDYAAKGNPDKFYQEYECSFDAAVQGAVFAKQLSQLRAAGRVSEIAINPMVPVNTAWDLGWDDATAIWFFQHIGKDIVLVDYEEVNHTSIPELVNLLDAKCKEGIRYRYGYHLMPHDVEVKEMGTGKSRRKIFSEGGVRVKTVKRTGIPDQIAAAQRLLLDVWISGGRCQQGLDRLALYHRKKDDRLGTYSQNPVHDDASHAASALMTLAMGVKKNYSGSQQPPVRAEL